MSGFQPQSSASVWTYGAAQYTWETSVQPYHAAPDLPAAASTLTGVASSFAYTFPAYSITVLELQPK